MSGGRNGNGGTLPWTHRHGTAWRVTSTVLAGAAVAVAGTLAHRMGAADGVPYGLAMALAVVALSAAAARTRLGAAGVALHLIASSLVAWGIALASAGGDVLTPAGFAAAMPFFSQHAGYLWLFGLIVVQLAILPLPARWFALDGPSRRDGHARGDA